MSKLQTSTHREERTFLRIAGLLMAGAGLVLTLIGMLSFFSAFGSFEPPRLFWCAFIGLPLLAIGGMMCIFGFMGAVSRYTAAEQMPVVTDAVSDLADGTQDAVKTVARAVTEGVKEGLKEKQ
jgi:hypothetical protein